MNTYPAKNIINVAMAGHSGAGKTSLAEAMLYLAGASDRRGKVGEGNTVCDSDPEEIRRKTSVSTAVAPFEWKNKKINLLDTPGLFDFQGGLYEAARAAESVVIVLAGKSGVSVGTEKAFAAAEKRGLSKIFFVNGLCDEGSDFYKVFEDLKASFGPSVCPIVVPYFEDGKADKYINMLEYKAYDYSGGKPVQVDMPNMGARLEGLRTAIYEAVAETSDELFEKYFSGEEFTPEEVIVGVSQGVKSGTISPVFCGDAMLMRGMEQFMDGLCWLAPSAADKGAEIGVDVDGNPVEIAVKEDAATAAIVFKTVADPFIGKLSYVKVLSGKISTETPLINMRTGNTERVGKTVMMCGKKQEDVKAITAGDIGAIPKLAGVNTGDTLCAPARKVTLDGIAYPTPEMRMAIVPKNKGDEDKVAQGIMRLAEEDPTIRFENNAETKEMVISGMGEQHLDVIVAKLKTKFGVDVTLRSPRVPYRETIRKTVSVQGRHKKQTGGHGQFGDVWIEFSPCDADGLEFAERVVGGAVPKGFFPAVEKGTREAMRHGVLAGYPMTGVKATLFFGKYHPVDSKEVAFKSAARLAYKEACAHAAPALIEPIYRYYIHVPNDYVGAITSDLPRRRGVMEGMNPTDDGTEVVARAPMGEMVKYATDLRSMTQARGYFTKEFIGYEDVPGAEAKKIIEQAKREDEEEE